VRRETDLPILLKGIVRPDDGIRAVKAGMQGVIVSNHGGRQLDGAPATADVLERCTDAIKGARADATVLVDGGIRRGTDVLRALALGADGTLIGRPMLWGLAVHGEAGVRRVLDIMHAETSQAMALAGCPDLRSITRDLLERAS
jgi:4-hydroxymandelate oxidase